MSDQGRPMEMGGGNRFPIPDPTALTTEAVDRLETRLKELIEAKFEGRDNLNDERFRSVDNRFEDVEARRAELKVDNQREVSTALTATNAAIDKTEKTSKESLQQMNTNLLTEIRALRRDTESLATRVTIVESVKVGAVEQRRGLDANIGLVITVVLFAIAVVGFLATKGP